MVTLYQRLRAHFSLLTLILRYRWRTVRWALTALPIAGAADDADADNADDSDSDADDSNDDADDSDKSDDADDKSDDSDDDAKPSAKREPDWKRLSRKHERDAKRLRKELDEREQKLKAREDQDKSEQEKKIEEAEQRARTELQGKHDTERRQDRLEVATTRIAAKGIKVGDGDDAKTLRFADPDDALVYLERDIASGDLDPDDIFDEKGKVRADQLQEALSDLLDRKPHLAESGGNGSGGKRERPKGSADGGKGTAAKDEETVEDHFKKIRRHRTGEGAKAV